MKELSYQESTCVTRHFRAITGHHRHWSLCPLRIALVPMQADETSESGGEAMDVAPPSEEPQADACCPAEVAQVWGTCT